MAASMASMMVPILLSLWFTLYLQLATAISPISVKGTKLYDNDGKQFFIKGVAYSSGNIRMDPLLDTSQCQIDAGLMKTLGVNTIRVYTVDGNQNHDGCMQAFATQGIYIWLDLQTPFHAINRLTPDWNMDLYTNWTTTMDAFAGYDNLLSFLIGNEVINELSNTTIAAPYLKAATRDIKAFRNARGYRKIPISYSSADVAAYRVLTADYLACGDSDDAIDMYGMNIYSWCGNSSYYLSGFDKLYEQFQDLNIPVMFSETGCKPSDGQRDFAEVATMLGPVFQAVFSGTVVYEWTMEDSGYGIVEYSNSRNTGFPGTLDDYNALATVFSSVNPTGTVMTEYTPSNSAPACPTSDSSAGWSIDGDVLLPTIPQLEAMTVTARTTIVSTTSTVSHTTTNSESRTSVGGSSNSASTTSDSQISSEEKSSGLSTGAIVGVVIGCIAAVLLLGGTGALFWMRKRKEKQRAADEKGGLAGSQGNDSRQGFKAELPAQSVKPVLPRQEMDATHQAEQAAYNQGYNGQHGGDGSIAARYANMPSMGLYEMDGAVPNTREGNGAPGYR